MARSFCIGPYRGQTISTKHRLRVSGHAGDRLAVRCEHGGMPLFNNFRCHASAEGDIIYDPVYIVHIRDIRRVYYFASCIISNR